MKFEKLNSVKCETLSKDELGIIKGGAYDSIVDTPGDPNTGLVYDRKYYNDSGNELNGNPIGLDLVGSFSYYQR